MKELLERLQDAVRIRLVADVPLGAFLSGGIDSSTVVALMAGLMGRPVKTFSIGFSEHAYDEASDAKLVARHLGTDHTELILTPPEAQAAIPGLLDHFDEPFADSSAIPTYYVSKLARQQVTVVLSGDGGDELFGGYPWRQVPPAYQRALTRLPAAARRTIRGLSQPLPAWVRGTNFLRHLDVPYPRYLLDCRAIFDAQDREGLYSADAARELNGADPYLHLLPHLSLDTERPWPTRIMEYDLKTYLPNDILTKVDRMSMLNSLEARVPLLDHPLVEFAAKIPSKFKIRNGVAKYILKKVIAPLVPPPILTKRKHGFSIPLETWLRTDLRNQVLDTLQGGNQHGIFNRQALDKVIDAFFRGDDRRNHQVWTLFALEHWYQNVYSAAPASCTGSDRTVPDSPIV